MPGRGTAALIDISHAVPAWFESWCGLEVRCLGLGFQAGEVALGRFFHVCELQLWVNKIRLMVPSSKGYGGDNKKDTEESVGFQNENIYH